MKYSYDTGKGGGGEKQINFSLFLFLLLPFSPAPTQLAPYPRGTGLDQQNFVFPFQVWEIGFSDEDVYGSPHLPAHIVAPSSEGERFVVTRSWGKTPSLRAHSVSDGSLLWSVDGISKPKQNIIAAASHDTVFAVVGDEFISVATDSGTVRWRSDSVVNSSQIVLILEVLDGIIITVGSDTATHIPFAKGVSSSDGSVQWIAHLPSLFAAGVNHDIPYAVFPEAKCVAIADPTLPLVFTVGADGSTTMCQSTSGAASIRPFVIATGGSNRLYTLNGTHLSTLNVSSSSCIVQATFSQFSPGNRFSIAASESLVAFASDAQIIVLSGTSLGQVHFNKTLSTGILSIALNASSILAVGTEDNVFVFSCSETQKFPLLATLPHGTTQIAIQQSPAPVENTVVFTTDTSVYFFDVASKTVLWGADSGGEYSAHFVHIVSTSLGFAAVTSTSILIPPPGEEIQFSALLLNPAPPTTAPFRIDSERFYVPAGQYAYIGQKSQVAKINAETGEVVWHLIVASINAFDVPYAQVNETSNKLFLLIPSASRIVVIDTKKGEIVAQPTLAVLCDGVVPSIERMSLFGGFAILTSSSCVMRVSPSGESAFFRLTKGGGYQNLELTDGAGDTMIICSFRNDLCYGVNVHSLSVLWTLSKPMSSLLVIAGGSVVVQGDTNSDQLFGYALESSRELFQQQIDGNLAAMKHWNDSVIVITQKDTLQRFTLHTLLNTVEADPSYTVALASSFVIQEGMPLPYIVPNTEVMCLPTRKFSCYNLTLGKVTLSSVSDIDDNFPSFIGFQSCGLVVAFSGSAGSKVFQPSQNRTLFSFTAGGGYVGNADVVSGGKFLSVYSDQNNEVYTVPISLSVVTLLQPLPVIPPPPVIIPPLGPSPTLPPKSIPIAKVTASEIIRPIFASTYEVPAGSPSFTLMQRDELCVYVNVTSTGIATVTAAWVDRSETAWVLSLNPSEFLCPLRTLYDPVDVEIVSMTHDVVVVGCRTNGNITALNVTTQRTMWTTVLTEIPGWGVSTASSSTTGSLMQTFTLPLKSVVPTMFCVGVGRSSSSTSDLVGGIACVNAVDGKLLSFTKVEGNVQTTLPLPVTVPSLEHTFVLTQPTGTLLVDATNGTVLSQLPLSPNHEGGPGCPQTAPAMEGSLVVYCTSSETDVRFIVVSLDAARQTLIEVSNITISKEHSTSFYAVPNAKDGIVVVIHGDAVSKYSSADGKLLANSSLATSFWAGTFNASHLAVMSTGTVPDPFSFNATISMHRLLLLSIDTLSVTAAGSICPTEYYGMEGNSYNLRVKDYSEEAGVISIANDLSLFLLRASDLSLIEGGSRNLIAVGSNGYAVFGASSSSWEMDFVDVMSYQTFRIAGEAHVMIGKTYTIGTTQNQKTSFVITASDDRSVVRRYGLHTEEAAATVYPAPTWSTALTFQRVPIAGFPPVLVSDASKIVLADSSNLFVLDTSTGIVLQRHALNLLCHTFAGKVQDALVDRTTKDRVIFGTGTNCLSVFDITSDTVSQFPSTYEIRFSQFVQEGMTLLVVDELTHVFALNATGNISMANTLWKLSLGRSHTTPQIVEFAGLLYLTSNNFLYCVDPRSGQQLWEESTPFSEIRYVYVYEEYLILVSYCTIAAYTTRLNVPRSEGRMRATWLTSAGCAPEAVTELNDPAQTVLLPNGLLVVYQQRTLFAYNLSLDTSFAGTGSPQWSRRIVESRDSEVYSLLSCDASSGSIILGVTFGMMIFDSFGSLLTRGASSDESNFELLRSVTQSGKTTTDTAKRWLFSTSRSNQLTGSNEVVLRDLSSFGVPLPQPLLPAPASTPPPITSVPPGYVPQGVFSNVPSLPPGVTMPDLGCVHRITMLGYSEFVFCVDTFINATYQGGDVGLYDRVDCFAAGASLVKCSLQWLKTTEYCPAAVLYLQELLNDVGNSTVLGFCGNGDRCNQGNDGASYFCSALTVRNGPDTGSSAKTLPPMITLPAPANTLPSFTYPGKTTTSPVTLPPTTTLAPGHTPAPPTSAPPTTQTPRTSEPPVSTPTPASSTSYYFTCSQLSSVATSFNKDNFEADLQVLVLTPLKPTIDITWMNADHTVFSFVFSHSDAPHNSQTLKHLVTQTKNHVESVLHLTSISPHVITPPRKLSGGVIAFIVILVLVVVVAVSAVVAKCIRSKMRGGDEQRAISRRSDNEMLSSREDGATLLASDKGGYGSLNA